MPEQHTTIKKKSEPTVAAPAAVNPSSKLKPLKIIGLILLAVVIVGGFVFWAVPYLFPPPLSLPAGTDLQGRLVIENNKLFHVGDLIPVTIEVESRNGVKYQMPDLANLPLGQLELKERDPKPSVIRRRDGKLQQEHLLLTCWEVGEHPFPALTVTYQTAAKSRANARRANVRQLTAQIPARTIVIRSLLPANRSESELLKLDIKGLKGPVGLPPRYEPLWWFGAALLVGLLVWLLVKYLSKLRGKKDLSATPATQVIEPAHLIAFRRLAALKNAGYLEQGDFKTYYSELSECIREYMENRFQIRALEMTTEEFLAHLANHKNTRIQFEFQAILREFLNSSDLIKFAKHRPVIEDAEGSYNLIRDLIEKTKETPAPLEAQEVEGLVQNK
ncbi:MAG TPA: hypothetical protein VHY08_00460 [Bacillota bacterium]|nr:hypothetical protein [Bacillota bacterium]